MFLPTLLLAVATAPPLAVDVTGMPPQLAIIRHDAAQRGWRVTCEGHSGEEKVLRLEFTSSDTKESVSAYFIRPDHVGSSRRFYYKNSVPSMPCDIEPTTTSGVPSRVLAIGDRNKLTPLLVLAKDCGYSKVVIRKSDKADIADLISSTARKDWFTLDAGENIAERYGPAICFVQLQTRVSLGLHTPDAAVR